MASAPVQCLVWRPRGEAAPRPLLDALERRRIEVTTTDSPYHALARLCRLERPEAHGVSQGETDVAAPPHVLLLDRPESLEDPGAVVRSIARYAPKTACWLYEPTDPPTLRAVEAGDVRSWIGEGETPADTHSQTQADEHEDSEMSVTTRVGSGGESGSGAVWAGALAPANPAPAVGPPTLRLAGDDHDRADGFGAAHGGGSKGGNPNDLLSDDELSMLLAEDPLHDDAPD